MAEIKEELLPLNAKVFVVHQRRVSHNANRLCGALRLSVKEKEGRESDSDGEFHCSGPSTKVSDESFRPKK
jgi:hypothetical protein